MTAPPERVAPGLGLGWSRVAQAVAQAFPPAEITGIWVFPPIRREEREWGTAAVARRTDDGRVRVYTARYMLVVKGRERGQGKVAVDEVGTGPDAVVADVIKGVQDRSGETEPPVEIGAEFWFGDSGDESAPQG